MIRELPRPDLSRLPTEEVRGLGVALAELVGQPFRFLKFSYGDELTIHFGDVRPGRASKLSHLEFGAYILSLRCSPWLLKSGAGGTVFDDAFPPTRYGEIIGVAISNEALESRILIEPGSLVLQVSLFTSPDTDSIGLEIQFDDGSLLLIRPGPQEPDEPGEVDGDELADWELLGPNGLIEAGPGPRWTFEPSASPPP